MRRTQPEYKVFTDLKEAVSPWARGMKVSFYHFRPPCFHYLKRAVFTPQLHPAFFYYYFFSAL